MMLLMVKYYLNMKLVKTKLLIIQELLVDIH